MRRKRRNHSSAFKAKVALAAIKGERTLTDLAEQLDVHSKNLPWNQRKIGLRYWRQISTHLKDVQVTGVSAHHPV